MRTTEYRIFSDTLEHAGRNLHEQGVTDPYHHIHHALGYLSSWNLSLSICHISASGPTDFLACYYRTASDSTPAYVIEAVWHEDHYGFHS